MAQKNQQLVIDNGPSKLDLMLSLFDTKMGVRTAEFHTPERIVNKDEYDFKVLIVSVRRLTHDANHWEIEGYIKDSNMKGALATQVLIHYLSDTREGVMRLGTNPQDDGPIGTPADAKKARAFMEIIFRMIHRYQKHNAGFLDNGIFELFERAKRISYAEDSKHLDEAIKDIETVK